MKNERISFLASPGLKEKLKRKAAEANVSVSALIRAELEASELPIDEVAARQLLAFAVEFNESMAEPRLRLHEALTDAKATSEKLRQQRIKRGR